MSMTTDQRTREDAIRLCRLAASAAEHQLLPELAHDAGLAFAAGAVQLARRAVAASLGAGNWREVRAEAEAKLREGWRPT